MSKGTAVGLAAGAILAGSSALYGPRLGLPVYWFAPLAAAGLIAAFVFGVRWVASPGVAARLGTGIACVAAWLVLLPLPAPLLWKAFVRDGGRLPAPPGAICVTRHDRLVNFHPFHDRIPLLGYTAVYRSGLTIDEIEVFYRRRLPELGWRSRWTRDLFVRANGAGLRRCCFRRADGLLILSIGRTARGESGFRLIYDHLGDEGSW